MALSYCGQDGGGPSLLPLNVVSNVELHIAGRPTDIAIDTRYDTNREHIVVTVPMQELRWIREQPFTIEWLVGGMKSNILLADLPENSGESTTLYPTAPRPPKLRSVKMIAYADYNWSEETPDRVLDKQRLIGIPMVIYSVASEMKVDYLR